MTDPVFPFFANQIPLESEPERWLELHLYSGSKCNRACVFCCVNGEPKGTYSPWTEETLQAAARLVARRGGLKFYGGEPTLDPENLIWSMGRLRELGFEGAFIVFSNGVRARELVSLLEADLNVFAVLNYSIATGRGETPLPASALRQLQNYDEKRPGHLFLSHDFVVPVGRQRDLQAGTLAHQPCFRCFPTLTSEGKLHACAFAVEYDRKHFRLGDAQTDFEKASESFSHFLGWVEERLDPVSLLNNQSSCSVCIGENPPEFTPLKDCAKIP